MTERVQRQPPVSPKPKAAAQPVPTRKTKPTDHSALSTRYETSGKRDPGRISTGKGDTGGMSYGPHQIAARTGTVRAFIASPEMAQWAQRFHGMKPEMNAFNAQWQLLAKQQPAAFLDAQDKFISRTHYETAVNKVSTNTGYNLNAHSEALRQVTYSTAVQHGASGGPQLIKKAISLTDRNISRFDPQYERKLIYNIYYLRAVHFTLKRDEEIKRGLMERAKSSNNVIKRFRDEHEQALLMLLGRQKGR